MTGWFEHLSHAISERTEVRWILAIFVSFCLTVMIRFIFTFISVRWKKITEKNRARWHQVVAQFLDSLKSVVIFIWMLSLFSQTLQTSETLARLMHILFVLFTSYQVVIWGMSFIQSWRDHFMSQKLVVNGSSKSAIGLMYMGLQTFFICLIFLLALSNIGIDVGALLAGLGVGGIAVALAAQNVLGDLLASLSIVFDKPFVIGDLIHVGNEKGTVEHIGIKTTRLRSLSGEELIFSNKDLLESRIQNFKRMSRRRVVQRFGVVYSTGPEVLEKIPQWVKSIIESIDNIVFERCHFYQYGNSSLDFELVVWVLDPDFNFHMDLQQTFLLEILKKFQMEKVNFAYPTQTILMEKFPCS